MKSISPKPLHIITLYEALDDTTMEQLLDEAYRLYWAGNPDWIGRNVRHPSGKGYQPCWLRFETQSSSQQPNNLYNYDDESTSKMVLQEFDELTQLADDSLDEKNEANEYPVDRVQSHLHLASRCIHILTQTSFDKQAS